VTLKNNSFLSFYLANSQKNNNNVINQSWNEFSTEVISYPVQTNVLNLVSMVFTPSFYQHLRSNWYVRFDKNLQIYFLCNKVLKIYYKLTKSKMAPLTNKRFKVINRNIIDRTYRFLGTDINNTGSITCILNGKIVYQVEVSRTSNIGALYGSFVLGEDGLVNEIPTN
jgi:hypothetical protein